MFVSETSLKLVFPTSLVILLALSSIVRSQQSSSPALTSDKNSAAVKSGNERAPRDLPTSIEDTHDAKLAVYQVHRLGEKILALRSTHAKAFETARLAAALWKHDEPHARVLFEKALTLTIKNGNDSEARALSALHRRVIALIARCDADWAKRLIDAAAKRETEEQSSNIASSTNLRTAVGLLEDDPTVAVQFAERSLEGGISWGFRDFIHELRKKDEVAANKLFLQALSYLSKQATVDIKVIQVLGLYLFTAPDLLDSDYHKVTLVEDIFVPNITAERPGVPAALVRAYLATAADILWRMTSDTEQRKYSYALGYLLLPKTRNAAPDLTSKFEAIMAALAPQVPSGMTQGSAFRYMKPVSTTIEEKLSNAENKADQESRDMAYLEIALQSWHTGDFKTARIAQGRISILEASQRLAAIIDFREGTSALKENAANIEKAEAMASRLPQGMERSILLQAIAKNQSKASEPNLTEETIDKALKATRSIADGRRPFLLLTAAAQLANLNSAAVHIVMAEVVKDFNSFKESALSKLDWAEVIQVGPMRARFPLDDANIDLGFNAAFHTVALADPEAAMARAEELRHEHLRAQSLVEVGKAFLDKIPSSPLQNQQPQRPGPKP